MSESVASLVERALALDGTAFVHRRGLRVVRWSYREVAACAYRFARALDAHNVATGDRVVIWGESSPEWVAAFFGCMLRGAIAVPLDRQSTPEFVALVVEQVAPALVVADFGNRAHLTASPFLALDDLTASLASFSSSGYECAPVRATDTAEIVFTSGTTATPKGVRITHGNLLSNLAPLEREIAKYRKWERLVHPIRFLNVLPLSHVFGQFMGMLVPILLGGEVHLAEALSPGEIVETIRRDRISVVAAVPRVLQAMRAKVERDLDERGALARFRADVDASGTWGPARRWWRFRAIHRAFGPKFWAFVSGGATLDEETEAFWRRLGFAVVQGYGMTETASLISVNHPFKMSHGSIGKVLPGQEVKLGENGEILVRGGNVSPGYWQDDEGADDGWFRTGDLGAVDDEGNLYFKGRQKYVIVTAAGMNVHPEDLESALDAQPEVRASVVVGIDGPDGPEPVAAVIPEKNGADAAAAVARANRSLASYQEIRRWIVWPEPDFPRTSTRKVKRGDVASTVRALLAGDTNAIARRSPLAEVLGRVSGASIDGIESGATLGGDLALDSLARVELMSAIEERYQVDLDEGGFTAATTIGDLERLIARGGASPSAIHTYPRWTRGAAATLLRWLVLYCVTLPLARLLCSVRTDGRRRVESVRGPALFVSNHVASGDAVLILSALPGPFRRRLAIAMSGEMLADYRAPSASLGIGARLASRASYFLLVALFNVFPLPQRSGFRRSFSYTGELVDDGASVLLFPEGARTQDGAIHPFQSGVGVLATQLGVPVVPIRIDGLYEVKLRKWLPVWPGTVRITFGEPATYASGDDADAVARDIERRVRDA